MRLFTLLVVGAILGLTLEGCSVFGGLDGQKLGACTLRQANSFTAGIAYAECPANDGLVRVPGNAEGYMAAVGPILQGAAVGGGIAGAAGLVTIPQSLSLHP